MLFCACVTDPVGNMDGDLSEGGMQSVALNDGTHCGETQPLAGIPMSNAIPNSGVQPQLTSPSQPIPTPQARPTSLPQYPHNPGSAYTSPNSASSPGEF